MNGSFRVNFSAWGLAISLIGAPTSGADGETFQVWMNLGKAHLENREAAKAVDALTKAVASDPISIEAWRNLARAQLLSGQAPVALDALLKAKSVKPQSAATNYLEGLIRTRMGQVEEAVAAFESAVRLDPETAVLRYQLAGAYQSSGQNEKAVEQFRETVRLDPQHASAHYKLANLARQAGDQAGFQKHNLEFLRLRKLFGDESRLPEMLERCLYTLPEPAPTLPPPAEPGIAVRFVDATADVFINAETRRADALAVIEVGEDGSYEWIVASGRSISLMRFADGKQFERRAIALELPEGSKFHGCAVGDYFNDVPMGEKYDARVHARNDVLLLGRQGVRLLRRTGPSAFSDETERAGLGKVVASIARWVDYEHDGDLDLAIGGAGGLALWQNNGDGRFEDVTVKVGITPTGPVTDIAAADLDANTAVDLIIARGSEPTLVFENQRAGRFALMKSPPGPWPGADRLLVNDLDNDGRLDVVLGRAKEATILFGGKPDRVPVELSNVDATTWHFIDFDNDGGLDLLAAGTLRADSTKGGVELWRNAPPPDGWTDLTKKTGLDAPFSQALLIAVAADWDADGDGDLILLENGEALRILRNQGGNAHRQLKVRLSGIKTNPSGFGTRLEARSGAFQVTRMVDQLPIEMGIGRLERLDSLQTLWTNAVVDNQINVEVGPKPVTVLEKNVATGSCPFLYAWDGAKFRFVTDLLGNAPVGLSYKRNAFLPADPDEIVWIGDDAAFPARDGKYVLQMTDEFREIFYLDEAKLIAVDHPPDVEVHPTDKLMFPPFPPSLVWALGNRRTLRCATGDDGIDRTDAVREIDGVYAPPGRPLPPPYRGMCHSMALTMDFSEFDGARPWVLALTGWLQYGDASTNIALSQDSSLTVVPPTLFAESTAGEWARVDVTVGMPAGKTKTILVDLAGKLPAQVRRLRLSTTFEIRWDRVALLERLADSVMRETRVEAESATLSWRGFSDIRPRGPDYPSTPNHASLLPHPPWRTTLEGWCTRYGEVSELIAARDDKLAILNGGDALTVTFDTAKLPAPTAGTMRSFFLFTVGWDKDADHNVVGGDRVEPLPNEGTPSTPVNDDWQLEWNTRWVPAEMSSK